MLQDKKEESKALVPLTDEQVLAKDKEEFLKILEFETHGNIMIASSRLGLSRQTVYRMFWADPEFEEKAREASRKGKKSIRDIAEAQLITRLLAGDTTAIIFTLKNLDKENYGEGLNTTQITNKTMVLSDPRVMASLLGMAEDYKKNLEELAIREKAQLNKEGEGNVTNTSK